MTAPATIAPRVTFRLLAEEDEQAMAPWLAEAFAAVDGLRPDAGAVASVGALRDAADRRWASGQILGLEIDRLGLGGFLVWREERGPSGSLTAIRALAVRREWRNLGYGADAVEVLAAAHHGRALAAATPRGNGLALYFWLRVGFRPLRLDEDAERARDPAHLWMMRAADAPVSAERLDP